MLKNFVLDLLHSKNCLAPDSYLFLDVLSQLEQSVMFLDSPDPSYHVKKAFIEAQTLKHLEQNTAHIPPTQCSGQQLDQTLLF